MEAVELHWCQSPTQSSLVTMYQSPPDDSSGVTLMSVTQFSSCIIPGKFRLSLELEIVFCEPWNWGSILVHVWITVINTLNIWTMPLSRGLFGEGEFCHMYLYLNTWALPNHNFCTCPCWDSIPVHVWITVIDILNIWWNCTKHYSIKFSLCGIHVVDLYELT